MPFYKRLLRSAGDSINTMDCRKLKKHLTEAAQQGCLPRNNFDMNPVIRDMQTAINARVTSCGVTWGFRPRAELEALCPDHIVDRAEDIARLAGCPME